MTRHIIIKQNKHNIRSRTQTEVLKQERSFNIKPQRLTSIVINVIASAGHYRSKREFANSNIQTVTRACTRHHAQPKRNSSKYEVLLSKIELTLRVSQK